MAEYGFAEIEVINADTPWCADCRRFYHYAGDQDCHLNPRYKNQRNQKKQGQKEHPGREKSKGKHQGGGKEKQKEARDKGKGEASSSGASPEKGGNGEEPKKSNKDDPNPAPHAGKGKEIVVWKEKRSFREVVKNGKPSGTEDSGQKGQGDQEKEVEMREDLQQVGNDNEELEKTAGEEVAGKGEVEKDRDKEDIEMGEGESDGDADPQEKEKVGLSTMEEILEEIHHDEEEKRMEDREIRERDEEEEGERESEQGLLLEEEELLQNNEKKTSPSPLGDEDSMEQMENQGDLDGEGEGSEEGSVNSEQEEGNGEGTDAEEEDGILGIVGEALQGSSGGSTLQREALTENGPPGSLEDGSTQKGNDGFRIYDNAYFEKDQLREGNDFVLSLLVAPAPSKATRLNRKATINNVRSGRTPSKKAKMNDSRSVETDCEELTEATPEPVLREDSVSRKRCHGFRVNRKELSQAGPMKTLSLADRSKGSVKKFLVPLILSEVPPNGTLVLTRLTDNEVLEIPSIPVNSTPSDEEVAELTKRHVLHHTGSVVPLPTFKPQRFLSLMDKGAPVALYFAVLGLKSITDSFDKWCDLRVHWFPMQQLLNDQTDQSAPLSLPGGRQGAVIAEWARYACLQDKLSDENTSRLLKLIRNGNL
ncbi:hypothetical protein CBR_g36284 [Chara braunii]|uniref:Uncharacterized protein n=1 Tax=Chara braunii TaxID=69332 RepID=A0A388LKA6_CHABU|nr:hypothetical protein CBR_g36284 [Chara braunii]|eukprot:GBG82754.1 hypothetical protein CBR_g36284 [Chara braunii]